MGLKPGQKAPASGQYGVVGPRGGKIDHEVTVVKGEPMPAPGIPESLNVLLHELRGLGLSINLE